MNTQTVQLRDSSGNVWAEAQVIDQGDHFGGSIEFRMTPAPILALFEEFEEIVNGQMFACLDEIQEKIDSLLVKIVFDDGFETLIKDLQVFPHAGELSFRLPDLPPTIGGGTSSDARSAIGHSEFLNLLVAEFPNVAVKVRDEGGGLLHLEVAAFRRIAEEAMDAEQLWAVEQYFRFVERLVNKAIPDVKNALEVSFIEDLALGDSNPKRHRAVRERMPVKLRAEMVRIHPSWR